MQHIRHKNYLFWNLFLIFLLSEKSFATVSKTCLEPLISAIAQAENKQKKPLTYLIMAPAECQYYAIGELDLDTRSRIFTIIKAQDKLAGLDTKLSAVFGLLKLTPRFSASKTLDLCEALFFDLAEKKSSFKIKAEHADSKSECIKFSNQFVNEIKKFPNQCDNPIEVTSRDFRELFFELNNDYKIATQKPLPERLLFAFNAIKDKTVKILNAKCGNLK